MPRTASDVKIICGSENLRELRSCRVQVVHRGEPRSAVLIPFRDNSYACRNQCVHILQALDWKNGQVFDEARELIRCSMHGISCDPVTGLCQSQIFSGKALTSSKLAERDGYIYLEDRRSRISG